MLHFKSDGHVWNSHNRSWMITKLDANTVQRISSGQLILDILTILKELIENAIDGESTQITITIEDDGLTSIAVQYSNMSLEIMP